jgi:cytosine/adenosine deaminase-related metal-dependent hydrolase
MRVFFCPSIKNDNLFIYGDNQSFLASLSEDLRKFLTAPLPPNSLTGENYIQVVRDLHSSYNSPMCRIGFGPLAPQWCTKDLLIEVRREADRLDVPIHIHALETVLQKLYGLTFLDRTLIAHLNDTGMLGPALVIGHCIWATEEDIRLLAETGTGVVHNPSSNLRLRSGIAPVLNMLDHGVRVGLGLDGNSINDNDDMIQEMKLCFSLHRLTSLDLESPYLSARQVFQMATDSNASLLGYGKELGRLEPGRLADLVLLDYEEMCHPFVDVSHDPIDTLLYRGLASHIHTVMVNGCIVIQEGKLLNLDEEAINARLAKAASRSKTEEEADLARKLEELRLHVVRYYRDWVEKVELNPFYRVNSRVDRK